MRILRLFDVGLIGCLALATMQPARVEASGRAESVVTPQEWAQLALARCADAAQQAAADDEALEQTLATIPVTREQAGFLSRERASRAAAQARGRRAVLGRMNVLLFGDRSASRTGASPGPESLLDLMQHLLSDQESCAVEAIEGTALFGLLGIPFDEAGSRALRPDREFQVIEAAISEQRRSGATLEQIFERMRPSSTSSALQYLEAVTREVVLTNRSGHPRREMSASDVERRLREFLTFVTYAAEPLRVQFYLQGIVDATEGAFGATLQEGIDRRLFDAARRRLYGSVERMQQLGAASPTATLAALEPIVDRWFRVEAVPSTRKYLTDHPFAAYWYFVRTGGVAAAGPVFDGARTVVSRPTFALSDIERLPATQAFTVLEQSRLTAEFLDAHMDLESTFTDVTLTRDEVLERTATRMKPAERAKLRRFLVADEQSPRISALDVYSRIIRDASLIRGRLDWTLAREAIAVVEGAKAERLDRAIDRLLRPGAPPGLAAYLRTDAALMLELERRQVSEGAFKQGTAGAAVGWLLSQFFISGHVPVQLWAPDGVNGSEFTELVNQLTPKNRSSGADYHGKALADIDLVHDGREYHDALVTVIDSAQDFLNITSFDWKADAGGREIAYRLMAKKLGIDGPSYDRFLARFAHGLPMDPGHPAVLPFYDIPTARLKDLLVAYFIETSERAEISAVRAALEEAGATLDCATVRTCGNLGPLLAKTGRRYDARRRTAAYDRAWEAYQQLETLFSERPPALADVHPRPSIRDYCEDPAALRRFVRRVGLRRANRPDEPFPINIVADAKQNVFNLRLGEHSQQFPYFVTEPIRDIYFMLLEFDIRVLLWKGPMEFPWHIGPVPLAGRKILGVAPMPFIPWPWLNAVPGFQWAGAPMSIFLQYLLSTDMRTWWGMVSHTKSWSHESMALESGMGMGLKYFNQFNRHRTWHDMGVLVRGAVVNDVNDHFVQVYNEARVNNAGLPASRGASIPRLRYEDYANATPPADAGRTSQAWVLTTHPEQGDSNYRGVLVAALAAARRNIYVENSFFSDPLLARLLMRKAQEFRGRVNCTDLEDRECAAKMRDAVQIYLILPDSSDKPIVDAVGTSDFHDMLRLGIKVHRWYPESGWSASRMLHSKVWLIDYEPGLHGLAYVGAANATQRSHLADNEAGILSDDPDFARQVYERVFMPDITEASRIESVETFRTVQASNYIVRGSRWLRRLLVELFWFI